MSGGHRSGGVPSASPVTKMLNEIAAGHVPDRDRILGRLGSGADLRAAAPPPARPPTAGRTWALPVAAAAVVLLSVAAVLLGTGSAVTGLRLAGSTPAGGTAPTAPLLTTPQASASAGLAAGPAATPTPAPIGTVLEPGPAPDPAPGAAGPVANVPPAAAPPPTAPDVAISQSAVAAGHAVTLSSSAQGWVATVRTDGRTVRAESPRLALDLREEGTRSGRTGPFRVSWSGGAPEESHDDATGWLAVEPGGRVTVTVPALSAPGRLVLYLGARSADAVVTVETGAGAGRSVLRATGSQVRASMVTVPLPASPDPATVSLTAESSNGGFAGLSAVELR